MKLSDEQIKQIKEIVGEKYVDFLFSLYDEKIRHEYFFNKLEREIQHLKNFIPAEYHAFAEIDQLFLEFRGTVSLPKAIRQLKQERDRYREALEKIEEGDESEIWETFPDVTYNVAVMLYAKHALYNLNGDLLVTNDLDNPEIL